MPYYQTKTVCYHYTKSGNGQAILFAHGLFVDHTIFDHQVNHLKENYTCYSFDLPGHGQSSYNPEGWMLENIAEDFRQFIIDNHIHKPTLVGLSQGAMAFTRLAARYPDMIGRLVLVGSSHKAEPKERIPLWTQRIETFQKGDKQQIDAMFESIQQMIVGEAFYKNYPNLQQQELSIMQQNNYDAMIPATRAAVINRKNITGELSKITCPTLIACGSEDHATPKEIAEEMKRNISNSQLKIFDGAGHHIPIEVADFTTKLTQFLTDNPL